MRKELSVMHMQTITLDLPNNLYQQAIQRAQRMHSSLEQELLAILASALAEPDELPAATVDAMAQLAYLDDTELWQVAQSPISTAESGRMQMLTLKRQAEGLTAEEQVEAERLLQRFDRHMLVRSQAIALLHARGHDVAKLLQPPHLA
jgi:plasmid stability protein